MFIVKKFITYFLIPPGVFILINLILAFLTREKLIKRFLLFSALIIYFLSISPTKDFLLYPLIVKFENKKCSDFDAVVILGGRCLC